MFGRFFGSVGVAPKVGLAPRKAGLGPDGCVGPMAALGFAGWAGLRWLGWASLASWRRGVQCMPKVMARAWSALGDYCGWFEGMAKGPEASVDEVLAGGGGAGEVLVAGGWRR